MTGSKQPQNTAEELRRVVDLSSMTHYVCAATEPYAATYVSNGVRRQLGHDPEQFVGDSDFWVKHIHPADRPRVLADLETLAQSDRYVHEYRFQHADGSWRWMLDEAIRVRDDAGVSIEFVGNWVDITERKLTEEALASSEARYREAQRIANVGNWEFDVTLSEAWWSDEIYRMFGIDAQSCTLSHEDFLECVHPDDRMRVEDAVSRALHQREPHSVDYRILLRDGTEKTVHEQAEVSFGEHGQPLRVVGTLHDITDRKRAEDVLRENEKRTRALLDAIPDLIFRTDEQGRYLDFHATDQTPLAGTPQKFFERAAGGVFNLDFTSVSQPYIRRALETGETQSLEYQFAVQGEARDFEARFARSGDNEVVAIVRDITEQKRLHVALRESEHKLELILENVPDGVIVIEEEKISFCNPQLADMLGYPVEEVLETEPMAMVHPEDVEHAAKRMRHLLAGGETSPTEYRLIRKDGSHFHARAHSRPAEFDSGPALISVVHDLSDARKREQELLDYQTKLRRATEQLAETENRERRELAMALHDTIAQDLALSMLNLSTLRELLDSEEHLTILDSVLGMLNEATTTLRGTIFELSSPILYELGLEPAIRALTDQLQQQHRIDCTIDDDNQPRRISDDALTILFQSVRELLMNVIKHARAKVVSISIRTNGPEIEITVQDDGVGAQLDETDGVGLFYTQERLTAIGGHLKIGLVETGGTRCKVTAPLTNGNRDVDKAPPR